MEARVATLDAGSTMSEKEIQPSPHSENWLARALCAGEAFLMPAVLSSAWAGPASGGADVRIVEALLAPLGELHDNWDGHGAVPPALPALDTARRFLAHLLEFMPTPDVSPSTQGGVLLEWERGEVELLFAIDPMGAVEVVVSTEEGEEEEGPLHFHRAATVEALSTLSQVD